MDFNKICPHCMNQINEGVCSYCKKNPHEMPKERYYLRPFTILQGKFLVGGVRIEYGFIIIYNGMDIKRQMPVIIKEFYPKEFVTREAMISPRVNMCSNANIEIIQKWREGFLKEAKLLAGFANLPSVVSVKDYFEENNTLYMVMECLDGEYLKNFIKSRGGRISAEEIIKYMEPVIRDLSEVHKQGYIHASICPNEFMLLENGTMKLFAFDRAISFKAKDGKMGATLLNTGYSPKEQYLTRAKKGPWTDVYAICAIIYRCITGVTPLDSIERSIEDKMKWPTEMGISIDANFENILKKGMAVLAENRIQNMQQLYDAIYLSNTYSTEKCVEGAMPVKFVSIIGDSISTYEGYNPQGYAVFYNEEMQKENGLKSVYDTWWAKVNQALHGLLCVNNSYSGSKVSGKDFPAAISEQRMNMLKTKEFSPDYILIYMMLGSKAPL